MDNLPQNLAYPGGHFARCTSSPCVTNIMLDLLEIWHDYRSICLVIFTVVLIGLRIYLSPDHGSLRTFKQDDIQSPVQLRKDSKVSTTNLPKDLKSPKSRNRDVKIDNIPKRVVGRRVSRPGRVTGGFDPKNDQIQTFIFYSSLGGTTEAAAKDLAQELGGWVDSLESSGLLLIPKLLDLSYVEYDDYFLSTPSNSSSTKSFYLILIPTYNIDTSLNPFLEHLQETHHDFRIDSAPLASLLGYSVFGFGDKEGWPTEEEGFCSQAKNIDKWMAKLTSRKRAFPVGMGDSKSDWRERLKEWKVGVQEALLEISNGHGLGEGIPGSGNPEESDLEEDDEVDVPNDTAKKQRVKGNLDDVEDLGASYRGNQNSPMPLAVDYTTYSTISPENALKEMVPKSSPTYAALTKQGYTIVGSHSGVKICRWTKSALRGRGSCYKFSFYGIKSHLCMETTPSLSCSNKCVFCWRHGTNPVGTVWRWQVDPPEMIFEGVKEGHYKKIKMLKGVPGVRAERFAEAMRIRHCALSLVGEPIFYPHINEFLGLLHKEHISSFLVCNAQHPDQLAALDHVTQLYVSIDASNKESLKKIDRPLYRDFWERFQRCLDILREQRFRQRTVFRLTLVKGFNIEDEAEGYAELVARGLPCFVEVKGVTFCGTSTSAGAGLTMQNVPFYEEVCEFVHALLAALERRGLDYGIGAEHAHSCCVLIASTRFKIEGRWHTLIDYDKFFECHESGKEFGPEDYIGKATPEWALWGNGGFDPRDERFYRKKSKEQKEE
jgi:tRNA wybutosine-synthesizing protein 1